MAGWNVLTGRSPLLSIEITRECPLTCPGCYAYGESHLGGETNLRQLSDFRGDDLVKGVVDLVKKHKPLHVSLVGGEPLVRHRELSQILPILSRMGVFTLVVTSGIIPIPEEWMSLPRVRVTVSIDGLPEHHDVRRNPATYERILKNLAGREVNIHWTITRPMVARPGYLQEYVKFWEERPEVKRIWVSLYTPQVGEQSAEMLTDADRQVIARELPPLRAPYPKLLMSQGLANAFAEPPRNPEDCAFSKLSTNYTADLKTRVEPCIFGGAPDCSQCGCAISSGLHSLKKIKFAGPVTMGHLLGGSIQIGRVANRILRRTAPPSRLHNETPGRKADFVQIQP